MSAQEKPRSVSPPTISSTTTNSSREAGHQGARQRLVDRRVHAPHRRRLAHQLEILAHAVEHHDRVVDRVADDREHRGQHRQVEGDLRGREEAEDDDRIVQRRETVLTPIFFSKRNPM